MKKRVFAFALALCLCLALLPAAALAREPDDETEWKNQEPVDVTTAEALCKALPEGEPEPDENNIVWLSSARLAADIELTWENSVRTRGTLIVPEGKTLTIEDGASVEAAVENHGTILVRPGGELATTMGGEDAIANYGTITVEYGGLILSQMGGNVSNKAGGTLELNGIFACNGYQDAAWFRNAGTVSGSGTVLVYPTFGERSLDDRLSAYAAVAAAVDKTEITPCVAATSTAELATLSGKDVAGIFATTPEDSETDRFPLTESVDLGKKNFIVTDIDLELNAGATLTVAHRDKLAYVGRYSKVVVAHGGGTLRFGSTAIIGGTDAAGAIFTVTGGQMFTGGAEWAAFGHRYPTDASSEWYYVRYDGTVSAKGSLTEDTYLPLMVDGVLNVTGDFTTGSVEIRNELNEAGGKAYFRDLLYCWDSAECAVRGTEHTEFDLAFDLNCGNGYADVFDHLGYDRETGRFYLDAEPELVAPKREGYVFLGWEIVTKWNPTEEQLARIWVQKDEEDRDFVPWPTDFPCLLRAKWAAPDALGEGAIAQEQTVIAENGETMARAAIYCKEENCLALAARYDEAGRFLGVEPLPLTPGEFNELVLACGGAERVCFFAVNGGSAPLCPAASVERNGHA